VIVYIVLFSVYELGQLFTLLCSLFIINSFVVCRISDEYSRYPLMRILSMVTFLVLFAIAMILLI